MNQVTVAVEQNVTAHIGTLTIENIKLRTLLADAQREVATLKDLMKKNDKKAMGKINKEEQ